LNRVERSLTAMNYTANGHDAMDDAVSISDRGRS
jgi:hypothetical protein